MKNQEYLFSIFNSNGLNVDNIIVTVMAKEDEVVDIGDLRNKLHEDFNDVFENNNTNRSTLIRLDTIREWVVHPKEIKSTNNFKTEEGGF